MAKQAEKEGTTPDDVSRLFIYFVGRKRDMGDDPNKKVKDEGTSIPGAIDAMKLKGTCTEDIWPFNLDKVNARPSDQAFSTASNFKVTEACSVPVNLEDMKKVLADGYPIITGLKLTKRFFSPGPSGKIDKPDRSDPQSSNHGLHAMLIVGYSDANKVFIYRNSWGTDWGENGYGYVPYSYGSDPEFNFCGQYTVKGVADINFGPDADVEKDDDVILDDGEDGGDDELEDEEEDLGDDEIDDVDDSELFDKKAELMSIFRSHDLDVNGNMNQWELMSALWRMGKCVDPWTTKKILKDNDINESGAISLKEWFAMNGEVLPEVDGDQVLELAEDGSSGDKIRNAFETYDTDGSGTLSFDQMADLLHDLNPDITQERTKLLFQAADINSDGMIDYKEFVHWLFEDVDKPKDGSGVGGAIGGAIGGIGGKIGGKMMKIW